MYYIRYCYPLTVDPENPDAEHVDITTAPAGQPAPDWGISEWGPFESLEAAIAELDSIFPARRREDTEAENEAISLDETLLKRYRVGKRYPMGQSETAEWIAESLRQRVTADMSAKEIKTLAAELDALAKSYGLILYGDTAERIRDYRARLPE